MKTLSLLAITTAAAVIATSQATAENVHGYVRSNGTYVAPYFRTHANGNPYDNLSYRGYPSQEPGYISPRTYGSGTAVTMPRFDYGTSFRSSTPSFDSPVHTLPNFGAVHTSWDSSLLE